MAETDQQHDDQYSVGRDSIWPFGSKHKGTTVQCLPIEYCVWVVKNFSKGPWRKAVQREIAIREPSVAGKIGIKVDEKLEGGGYVQGRMDCSHLYRYEAGSHLEPWDGVSPPFDVDDDETSAEFRSMFGPTNSD